jgi:hypothetical protein
MFSPRYWINTVFFWQHSSPVLVFIRSHLRSFALLPAPGEAQRARASQVSGKEGVLTRITYGGFSVRPVAWERDGDMPCGRSGAVSS